MTQFIFVVNRNTRKQLSGIRVDFLSIHRAAHLQVLCPDWIFLSHIERIIRFKKKEKKEIVFSNSLHQHWANKSVTLLSPKEIVCN